MKHLPLNNQLFVQNRQRFLSEMLPGSIAVFNSNVAVPSNGDAYYPFQQNSDLYWLTGIVQEGTMLLLIPDAPKEAEREILVLSRPNEMTEKWNGRQLRADEGQNISGIQTVCWLDELDKFLQAHIHLAETIYLNSNESDHRHPDFYPTKDYQYIRSLQEKYPLHRYERAAKILKKYRPVKTQEEINVMQEAMDITDRTFRHLLGFIRPGVYEFEIEAEIKHWFLRQRADGEAYPSIIASGDRARTLHYVSNDQECRDGELVLMDFGARYGNYCADMTRTVPVNGRFSLRQKEVYNACLELFYYVREILKPGITMNQLMDKMGDKASRLFIRLGLLTDDEVQNEDPTNRAYRKYLYHGIGHQLGIDVHDLNQPFTTPLQKGMVLTIEPGIYIEAEKMGIRIENNVWLTDNGNIDLMRNIPITVEEIEEWMKKG